MFIFSKTEKFSPKYRCRDLMPKLYKGPGSITVNNSNHVIMTAFTYTHDFYFIPNSQRSHTIVNIKQQELLLCLSIL